MYEQLLDKHDFNGIKQLKRDTGVVIGVDEAINTVQEQSGMHMSGRLMCLF